MQTVDLIADSASVFAISNVACRDGDTLPEICAQIGRHIADRLVLMFPLPLSRHVRSIAEDEVRNGIQSMLEDWPPISPADQFHMQAIGWLAFDRRISLHGYFIPLGGEA